MKEENFSFDNLELDWIDSLKVDKHELFLHLKSMRLILKMQLFLFPFLVFLSESMILDDVKKFLKQYFNHIEKTLKSHELSENYKDDLRKLTQHIQLKEKINSLTLANFVFNSQIPLFLLSKKNSKFR